MYIENKEATGKEMRSSAILLIIVGFVGALVLLLDYLEVISIIPEALTSLMFYIVMGALFIIFFVTGIMSIFTSKRMIATGQNEANITEEILNWFYKEYDSEKIDESIDFSEESEEEKFLMRSEKISELILARFPDATESYLRNISEKIFAKLYE